MKKVLSVLLAVMMLAALMVPAFAVDKTLDENTASDTAEVKTDYSNLEETGGYYTVTFPAEINVVWGTEDTTANYTVETQLVPTATLKVTVAQDNAAMKNADSKELTYTLSGDTNVTGIGAFVTEEKALNIHVATADWQSVPVDAYSDTLTFTAEIAK